MDSKTHHYIHLNVKNIKVSDLKSCEDPLKLLDNIVDNDNYTRFITFSQDTEIIWETFNEIVRKHNAYVTTIKNVKEFIDKCLTNHYEQSKGYFGNNEIFTLVYERDIPDDTIVTIEFEES